MASTSATHVIVHPPSPSAALLESRYSFSIFKCFTELFVLMIIYIYFLRSARAGDFPDPLAHMTVVTIEKLKLMDYNTFFVISSLDKKKFMTVHIYMYIFFISWLLQGKTILVRAQIISYDTTASWYSTFCSKCKKLVRRRGNEWFCVTDGVQADVNYRYINYTDFSSVLYSF